MTIWNCIVEGVEDVNIDKWLQFLGREDHLGKKYVALASGSEISFIYIFRWFLQIALRLETTSFIILYQLQCIKINPNQWMHYYTMHNRHWVEVIFWFTDSHFILLLQLSSHFPFVSKNGFFAQYKIKFIFNLKICKFAK